MLKAFVAVPLIGIVVAVAVPLTRVVVRERQEAAALDALLRIREAQTRFERAAGGYATELASLMEACGGHPPALAPDVLEAAEEAGYSVSLRSAADAVERGKDCAGRRLASDYFVSAAPREGRTAGRQAFSARATGDVYLFYDGIAPDESDIARGLPTPLAQRDSFKIP